MAKNKVDITGINTSSLKRLSDDEMTELFLKLKEDKNNKYVRDKLTLGNLKLVLSILKRYSNRNENMDDLFQIGCIGLVKAIDNFDLSYNVKFSTYSVLMIEGEIRKYLRDNSTIRVSRSIKDIAYRVLKFKNEYLIDNGKEPSIELISKELDIKKESIIFALEATKNIVSYFEPIYDDGGETIYLFDQLSNEENDSELIKKTVEYDGEKVYFSIKDVDFLEKQIGKTKFTYKNETYQLNIEGDYNVENALAVIEAGLQLDIAPEKINDGLKQYCPIEKRWQIEEIGKYKIINDAYNANPDSMKASLLTIFELYPDTVLVLGDMGELGDDSVFYHRNIGEFILDNLHDNNYVKIITVGNLAKEIANKVNEKLNIAISFENNKQAADYIKNNIKEGSTIFLKASRSMKFEEIVNEIKGALL